MHADFGDFHGCGNDDLTRSRQATREPLQPYVAHRVHLCAPYPACGKRKGRREGLIGKGERERQRERVRARARVKERVRQREIER